MKGEFLFGPFRLDVAAKQLWRGDERIDITPTALDLLIYFADHAGEMLTREHLLEAVWPGVYVDDHALSAQIRIIRKALGDDARESTYIETRHRRGYSFRAPVARAPDSRQAAPAPAPVVLQSIPETRYADSAGVNIAYQVLGEGPIDLVFVMGWVSHLEYFWTEPRFARFLRRLSSFSRLILFDKRGTGLSDRVPLNQLPTIEQRMEDVRAVMDQVGSERAVICGISEGGCMSAVFAATYPERTMALVMIGTYARRYWASDYPWGPSREQRDHFLREIRQHWGGPVGLEERAPSVASDPHFREWWGTYLRMGASPGAALALTIMNSEVDIRNALPLVQAPTLVLHRTGDACLKVEEGRYVASQIPGARFVELPGDDHLPFVGDQEPVLREIERFLTRMHTSSEPASALATVLVAEMGDSESGLEWHIREQLERFRASRAESAGGSVTAAFDGPARAVRCAWIVRQQLRQMGAPIRMGLHTGECVSAAGALLSGPAVTVASRIRERARWGEALASGTVRDLVAGSGILFHPCGRLEAAGLGEWQLLRIERAGVLDEMAASIR